MPKFLIDPMSLGPEGQKNAPRGNLVGTFKDPPSGHAYKEIFEQLVAFTLSPEYDRMKSLVESVVGEMKGRNEEARQAA